MKFKALDGTVLRKETTLGEIRDRVVFIEVLPDTMEPYKSGKQQFIIQANSQKFSL